MPGSTADFFAPAHVETMHPGSEGWPHGFDDGSSGDWCPAQWAVLDTNQVLGHFEALQCILCTMTGVNLVVPRIVIKELELMECLEEPSGSCHARTVLQFLRSQLHVLDGFWCSSAGDRSSLVLQAENEGVYHGLLGPKVRSKGVPTPDDHVLACVRYFATVTPPGLTELLTNDCRLALEASFHGIPCESTLALMARCMPVVATTAAEYSAEICQLPDSEREGEDEAGLRAPPGLEGTKSCKLAGCSTVAAGCDGDCAASTDGSEAQSSSAGSESPPGEAEVLEVEPNKEQGKQNAEKDNHVAEKENENAEADAASVVLRGLPFSVTKDEVLSFVLKAGVPRTVLAPGGFVTLLTNAQGRPSGFVEVRLARGADSREVQARVHMQYHRGRYVEAFQSRPGR